MNIPYLSINVLSPYTGILLSIPTQFSIAVIIAMPKVKSPLFLYSVDLFCTSWIIVHSLVTITGVACILQVSLIELASLVQIYGTFSLMRKW